MPQQIPSTLDLAVLFEAALRLAIDPSGTGAINLRAGSDLAALVSMSTQLGNRVFAYTADAARNRSFADTNDDDALDEIVADIFGDKRKQLNPSTTTVYLKRTGTAATSINQGTAFGAPAQGTAPELQFEATGAVPAGANVLAVAVPVVCRTPGSVGNILQSSITQITDPLDDSTWVIYQPLTGDAVLNGGAIDVVAGGTDRETNDQLKARMNQRSLDTDRQRGTKAAIITGANTVPGVMFTTAVEPGDGTVILYAGDPSNQLSSPMSSQILTALEGWRALGIPVFVRAYAAQLVQVNVRLFMARPVVNYARAVVAAAAQKAIVNYFTYLPRPDEYYTDAIAAAAFSAHSEAQHVIVDAPASSQVRPADNTYGTVTALNRYYATPASVSVQILDPYHA